jgi:hypothetical protein
MLGSAILLSAQTQSQTQTMTGWVCNTACVVEHSGAATCDPTCGSTTGTAVFVSDTGKVMDVANQNICASHMNKHVKIKCSTLNHESSAAAAANREEIRIMDIRDESGGG